jgi:nudix-type nucleoside diphosphatase (YffH/AdpP family)
MANQYSTKYHRLAQREVLYEGFFNIEAYRLQRLSDQAPINRYVVQRPDAAVILLFNKETDQLYFVKQLRAPALEREADPYLIELPAGVFEPGENPELTVKREALEETGFKVDNPTFLMAFYASPGTFSEKIYAYYAEVTEEQKVEKGGGVVSEAEDIELLTVSRSTVYDWMDQNAIIDAKSLLTLQWFRSRDNSN